MPPLINRDNTCCFSGHRPNKLPWRDDLTDPRCLALREKIGDVCRVLADSGIRHFICGMALGCDMLFAEEVIRLREERENITLEAAIPCEEQAAKWSPALKKRYDRLVTECDKVTLISPRYTPDCMMRRNRYMVDHASLLLAVYNGAPGGTRNTLLYAREQGVRTVLLPIIEDDQERERL